MVNNKKVAELVNIDSAAMEGIKEAQQKVEAAIKRKAKELRDKIAEQYNAKITFLGDEVFADGVHIGKFEYQFGYDYQNAIDNTATCRILFTPNSPKPEMTFSEVKANLSKS